MRSPDRAMATMTMIAGQNQSIGRSQEGKAQLSTGAAVPGDRTEPRQCGFEYDRSAPQRTCIHQTRSRAMTIQPAPAAVVRTDMASLPPYGNGTLPADIRSRRIDNVNGLTVHMLEA